jgi:hypothetical protein
VRNHMFFCCSSPRFLSLSAAMERHLSFGSDRTLEFVAAFAATVSGPLMVAVVSSGYWFAITAESEYKLHQGLIVKGTAFAFFPLHEVEDITPIAPETKVVPTTPICKIRDKA